MIAVRAGLLVQVVKSVPMEVALVTLTLVINLMVTAVARHFVQIHATLFVVEPEIVCQHAPHQKPVPSLVA